MGRYYNGDIEGKFWFGLQSSDDAEYFGAVQDNWIQYEVYCDSLEDEVKPGIKTCREELGDYEQRFDKYFIENNGYNDNTMAEEMSKEYDEYISEGTIRSMLTIYARLGIGLQIEEWMEANPGENLNFTAEC